MAVPQCRYTQEYVFPYIHLYALSRLAGTNRTRKQCTIYCMSVAYIETAQNTLILKAFFSRKKNNNSHQLAYQFNIQFISAFHCIGMMNVNLQHTCDNVPEAQYFGAVCWWRFGIGMSGIFSVIAIPYRFGSVVSLDNTYIHLRALSRLLGTNCTSGSLVRGRMTVCGHSPTIIVSCHTVVTVQYRAHKNRQWYRLFLRQWYRNYSMLSHVCWTFTVITPMERNADIKWISNWYANCCNLIVLQNNAFNVIVLFRLYAVCGYKLYTITGLLHVNVCTYSWL